MNGRYTLSEAVKKYLLFTGDTVECKRLFLTQRVVLFKDADGNHLVYMSEVLSNDFFDEAIFLKELMKDQYSLWIKFKESIRKEKKDAILKLLSLNDFKKRVNCIKEPEDNEEGSYNSCKLELDPSNIIVSFEGEDETPFLELAPRKAYTC